MGFTVVILLFLKISVTRAAVTSPILCQISKCCCAPLVVLLPRSLKCSAHPSAFSDLDRNSFTFSTDLDVTIVFVFSSEIFRPHFSASPTTLSSSFCTFSCNNSAIMQPLHLPSFCSVYTCKRIIISRYMYFICQFLFKTFSFYRLSFNSLP